MSSPKTGQNMHRVGNNAPVHDGLTQKKTAAASPSADYDSEEEVSLLSSLIPETVRCSPHERTYAPLIALLLGKENLPYILRFCSEMNKEKRETILQQLIIVFRYYHCARRIMKNIITHEVKFNREDGFRLLHVYNRLYFSPYLKSTLSTAMQDTQQLIKQTSEMPSRQQHGNIVMIAKHFLDCIEGSIESVPSHLVDICAHVFIVSGELKMIGIFIFNHFFNPAIVFPETYQMWAVPPNPKERNVLVAISKLIQKLVNGREFLMNTPEAATYNGFVKDHQPFLVKFLADLATVKEKESETLPLKQQRLIMTRKYSNLHVISNDALGQALSKLNDVISEMFAYFPLPSDINENSYLHIIRTEEISEKVAEVKAREDFLPLMERFGTIIVPIEWVFHKKGMKFSQMGNFYSTISERQIDKDLQRDKIVINNVHVFQNENFEKVHGKIAEILLELGCVKEESAAKTKALSVLQTCGRTSSAGDAYDAILHVFGKNKAISVIADPGADQHDSPVIITIDKNVMRAEQSNTYRLMDQFYSQNSVWCRIQATTKWEFITANVTKQQLSTGIAILQYINTDSMLSLHRMAELQQALFSIHKIKMQTMT